MVMRRNVWASMMVSLRLAKFGNHMDCGSADIMLLMVEERDFTCPGLNLPLLFYF